MKKRKILIFDDEENRAERWAAHLRRMPFVKKDFEVETLEEPIFDEIVEDLGRRRQNIKQEKTRWVNRLDQADIFIIDFALLKLKRISYITGESLAYLARCYSRCGLIVALNQFGQNAFDLTLRGHPDSFADLNLGDSHVHNPGIWREPWKGFRPWVWPLLPRALDAYEKRVGELKSALDEPILPFLGLAQVASLMPRSTLEFIQSKGQKIEGTTFRNFVQSSRQGLRPQDDPTDDESIARIAAARIHKWLERLVLPGQDILVDAPYLVSRFPSLLKGDRKERASWNKIATLDLPSKSIFRGDLIERFRFRKENWVSRPCWFWGELSGYEEIAEVRDPWKVIEKADVVFCEDVSAFLPKKNAKEFVADLSSPFVRRYVKDVTGVGYQPRVRFAM